MKKATSFFTILTAIFLIASCKNKQTAEAPVKPDSLLILPDSVNSHYVDSNFIHLFFQQYPQLKNQSARVFKFYVKRNFQYTWFDNNGLREQAGNFVNLLNNIAAEGVKDSVVYDSLVNAWYNYYSDSSIGIDSSSSELEVMFTAQFFEYAERIWGGISDDKSKDLGWYISRKRLPYVMMLDSMFKNPDFFAENNPVYPQYDSLKKQLYYYQYLMENERWDSIKTEKKILKEGDHDSVILKIRRRLYSLQYLSAADTLTNLFDTKLDSAVRIFQQTHGLSEMGKIGKQTLDHLNTPLANRIEQIVVNMERCRWIPIKPQGDYITVNIPEFVMRVYADDTLAWSSKVVVGNNSNQTIIFNGDLKYVVMSPYWNVPPSIIGKEIIPACQKNSGYISSHNMEVVGASGKAIDAHSIDWKKYGAKNFPYIIRQKPGANNSLGRVKFLFPNEFNIYLHDTPAKSLFNETKRNFSHGCIRVSEPQKLAEFLLRNDDAWKPEKILKAMQAEKEVYVTLKKPVPVFIGYLTCFVDANAHLNFRDDVYRHDARLAKTLFENPVLQ